ncbi:MAG: TonB-dependent receptor [Proteobacteria bacterium]|nr:TonB-dependent receptor [Pseudomonadota bacterium]
MKHPISLFLLFLIFIFPHVAKCQQLHSLDEIVVTATRVETPVEEVASSISIVTSKEIEDKKEPMVLDVLRGLPGVDVTQTGGLGRSSSIYIRGANPEHTLVMIDGMEVNDVMHFGRLYDFSDLTIDNVERIEVLRGPQSTLYGSGAIGGVINIITKKGAGKPKFFVSGEGGSYNTFRESAGLEGSLKNFYYSLGISHINSKGISSAYRKDSNIETDGYDNASFSSRFGFTLGKHVNTDFIVHYTKTRSDIDNGGGRGGDDVNNIYRAAQLLLKGKVDIALFEGKWIQSIEFATNTNDRTYFNPRDFQHPDDAEKSSYNGRLNKIGWQHVVEAHKTNTLTFGVEYKEETGKSDYRWINAWGTGTTLFPEKSAHNTGYYIQDQVKLGEQFFGTIGLRLDDHSEIGSKITYRIAPAYFIKKTGTKIRGTYGTGERAPSLYQLYAPATVWGAVGNVNLKPEESKGWDFGIDQDFFNEKVTLGITYFSNKFKNLIDYDNTLGYVNIGKAQTDGVEFSTRIKARDDLTFDFSYTCMDTENQDTGESLLRRPKNKFSADTSYSFSEKGSIHLRVLYTGQRRDWMPYPSSGIVGGHTLVNIATKYNITKQIQLFARIENLLNRQYQEVRGYGTPGFSMYGGFKVAF